MSSLVFLLVCCLAVPTSASFYQYIHYPLLANVQNISDCPHLFGHIFHLSLSLIFLLCHIIKGLFPSSHYTSSIHQNSSIGDLNHFKPLPAPPIIKSLYSICLAFATSVFTLRCASHLLALFLRMSACPYIMQPKT